MLLNTGMSTLENVMQLLGLIIVFILILVITYYTTKWIGKANQGLGKNKNISVVETFRVTTNKYIQIIKVGEKYIAIGISKDHIEYLTEIDKEQLIFQEINNNTVSSEFKDILTNMIKNTKNKQKK